MTPDPAVPRMIAGRYQISGILGRGGMGEVYLARDHRLDTDVALKRVPPELAGEPNIREALIREAKILARLSDTHIVRLFDLADSPDGLFLVLEYVCGPSLDKVLAVRKTLSPDELRHVVDHVSQGLTRAHSLGVVHRDLKPSNLLVSLNGAERREFLAHGTLPPTLLNAEIKVTDFGLAKEVVLQSRAAVSQTVSGTPGYMAPEQFRGEPPSVETDVYALGFVAYVCLAGGLPIGDAQPIFFHLFTTPPPIANAPEHLNAAIQKAIRKERAERFPSAAEFAAALHAPATPPRPIPPQPIPLQPIPLQPMHRPKKQPKRWLILPAVLLAIMLISLLAARFMPPPPPASSVTEEEDRPAELSPLSPLNPAPRIDVPPPVVEQARLPRVPPPPPLGIQHPEILERLLVTGNHVVGFGPDGTVYLTRQKSELGAMRNGRLIWQFGLAGDAARFSFSPDGLLWVDSYIGEQRLFCFNAAGQGGELSAAAVKTFLPFVHKLQTTDPAVECAGSDVRLPGPRGVAVWSTALDGRCEGDPVAGRSGNILLQTKARTMYLLSNKGSVLWTYPAPCVVDRALLLTGDTGVALCSGRKNMFGVANGRQTFSIQTAYDFSGPLAEDREGNFYSFASTDVYDRHLLKKTGPDGRDAWTLQLKIAIEPSLALSPDGKIYLLGNSPIGTSALVIGDRPQQ